MKYAPLLQMSISPQLNSPTEFNRAGAVNLVQRGVQDKLKVKVMKHEKLKLFSKTRYSLSEEDRVVNALLIVLQDSNVSLIHSFFKELGIITNNLQNIEIRDHVSYDLENIVDGEILIPEKLLIALEAKVQKKINSMITRK